MAIIQPDDHKDILSWEEKGREVVFNRSGTDKEEPTGPGNFWDIRKNVDRSDKIFTKWWL